MLDEVEDPRLASGGGSLPRVIQPKNRDLPIMTEAQTFSSAGVVAPHPLAAMAGRDVLIEGGTIVEAALAAAMVTAVVAPCRNGLGGDALWLVREAGSRGRVRVLDARGLTGAQGRPERLHGLGHDTVPRHGPEAVLSVPGAVGGWAEARALATALGGRLPLERLLAPAIAAARDGFDPLPRDAAALATAATALADQPGFAATFLVDGQPPAAGTPWRLPALGATLDYLARGGLDDLYRGDVGRELAIDLETLRCPLERNEVRRGEARWRAPVTLDLGREEIAVAPHAPAVAVAVALGLFAGLGLLRPESFDAWHGLIESLRLAPELMATAAHEAGGIGALLDRDVLKRAAERIDRSRAGRGAPPAASFVEDAAFIGAVDRDGAAVALVQTLGGAWGSGIVSGRTGILLGNRGAALVLDPTRGPMLAPGRRAPLLSTPMLLSNRDGRVASLGATGAEGGSLVVQVASRLLAGASAETAVAAPRFVIGSVDDGDPVIRIEADREPEPARLLRAAGHHLLPGPSAAHRTLSLATRLPSGRIEGLSDEGEAAVAGL